MGSGNRVRPGSQLRADVCVVGAGAAGISVAQALAGGRLRVALVESGGRTPDPATQALYRGRVDGPGQPPLDQVRLRWFGGTTNHWAGWSGPFAASVFAARDWVPDSGWPITRAELDPWYAAAHPLCDLGPWDYGEATWGAFAAPLRGLAGSGARQRLVQHSAPTRFGEKFGPVLAEAANVNVLLESNAVELVADPELRTIRALRVRTLAGNEYRVVARVYVLACGAIENARLLLASNAVDPDGIGNAHDLVGRYFMDHPRIRPAGLLDWADAAARKLEQFTRVDGVRATAALELDADAARRDRLTHSLFFAEGPLPEAGLDAQRSRDLATARFLAALGGREAALSEWWIRCEQAPNPESRVRLDTARDALGQPRANVTWRLQELDRHTLYTAARAYARLLSRSGLARVELGTWLRGEGLPADTPVTGDWHHMGTTRMARAPDRGVVDPDCRVFGIDNLYVAGASVFPSSGAMNPTLTLVALALRLAEHVRAQLG